MTPEMDESSVEGSSAHLLNARTGTEIQPKHGGIVNDVAFTPDD